MDRRDLLLRFGLGLASTATSAATGAAASKAPELPLPRDKLVEMLFDTMTGGADDNNFVGLKTGIHSQYHIGANAVEGLATELLEETKRINKREKDVRESAELSEKLLEYINNKFPNKPVTIEELPHSVFDDEMAKSLTSPQAITEAIQARSKGLIAQLNSLRAQAAQVDALNQTLHNAFTRIKAFIQKRAPQIKGMQLDDEAMSLLSKQFENALGPDSKVYANGDMPPLVLKKMQAVELKSAENPEKLIEPLIQKLDEQQRIRRQQQRDFKKDEREYAAKQRSAARKKESELLNGKTAVKNASVTYLAFPDHQQLFSLANAEAATEQLQASLKAYAELAHVKIRDEEWQKIQLVKYASKQPKTEEEQPANTYKALREKHIFMPVDAYAPQAGYAVAVPNRIIEELRDCKMPDISKNVPKLRECIAALEVIQSYGFTTQKSASR